MKTWNKRRIKCTNFLPASLDSKPTLQLPFMPFNHERDLQNDDFPFGSLVEDPKPADDDDDDDDVIPKQIILEALDEP